jgi:tetratricopeptide (TPR) repeat protein
MHSSHRVFGIMALCLVMLHASGRSLADGVGDTQGLSQSLAAAEQRLGTSHPDLLAIIAPLAQSCFRDADIAEAKALRRRALKIAIDARGSDSVPAAEAMLALASLYIDLRQYFDAEPLLIIAGDVLTTRLGAEHQSMAPVLSHLASIALARGDKRSARNWIERAVAIDEKNHSDDRSERLRTLGAMLAAEERFDESSHVLRQAVARDREGTDELATARSLLQLANTFLREKRFSDALPLVEEATAIDQGRLGSTHPLIVDDFYSLGLVYLETERAPDAQKAFQAAINLLNRGAGRDTPRAAYIQLALARAVHEQGREEESSTLFAEAQRILNAAEEEEREREREI